MANGWKMFDVTKPGRGIDNNREEKRNFFEFWALTFRKFWALLELGLLYVLLSLPLLTNGLACAGTTFITRNFAREKPVFLVSDYFSCIKKNWKQALPVGIINLILGGIMVYSALFYYFAGTSASLLCMALVLALFVAFIVMQFYIYVMMVTFKFKIRQLYKNSFHLIFLGWKENLIILGTLIAVYGFLFSVAMVFVFSGLDPIALLFGSFALFFLPPFRMLLTQFYVFPVVKRVLIDPYYKEHPEEFEAARHHLNLENEETRKADEEKAIFHDVGSAEGAPEPSEDKPARNFPKQYANPTDDEDDTI